MPSRKAVSPAIQQIIRNTAIWVEDNQGHSIVQTTAEMLKIDVKTVRKALRSQLDKRTLRETWKTKVDEFTLHIVR
jgi:hypothetical protein